MSPSAQTLPLPRATELCIGPMSVNIVRTVIDLAYDYNLPLTLIASRRQIECAALGKGYVNSWTTEQFADFVKLSDPRGLIRLARDHGGPWQGDNETHLTEPDAMARAMESYRADILSGFTLLHLDPNKNRGGEPPADIGTFTRRTKELLVACHQIAKDAGREVGFEIGTDEGLIGALSPSETERFILEIAEFCRMRNIPSPEYAVVQTGSKVMETRNIGTMSKAAVDPQLQQMAAICRAHGIQLKQHNTDYLPDDILAMHPRWGIDAANVAPEFGIVETGTLLKILRQNGAAALAEEILALALASGKWDKWMLPDSQASDEDRAIIAGHYIFATPEFISLKAAATRYLAERGLDLDAFLCAAIRMCLERYLTAFGQIQIQRQDRQISGAVSA